MKIIIALGGNALQAEGKPATAEAQLEVIKNTVKKIIKIIKKGHQIILVHGNGPQVGRIIIQNEYSKNLTPAMPFDICGAMSQGSIGYHLQQALRYELLLNNMDIPVSTIVTQVVIDNNDVAFKNPTKPIGLFYSKEEADELVKNNNYTMKEDAGRGYRRVVPSPLPQKIVELKTIKTLFNDKQIVITTGGGGIPVIEKEDNLLEGVAAVIDKDFAAEKLAEDLDADMLIILTAVDNVSLNYKKENEKTLYNVSTEDLKKYVKENHFAEGSMLPKINAAIKFSESKIGRLTVITSLENASKIGEKNIGTTISS